jgi:autotransporter-associated beta strand protein
VTQSGAGTTILLADNSYAGTTTVSGGTLQVGNAGTTGTLGAGDVTMSNNANLSYVLAEATTISNNISGTGNVSASISGASSTLTVSSPINLTGSTTSNVVNLAADNNISVAARIDTTNTTSSAVLLNAGKSTNVGTSTGGDISFSGSGTVTVGTGGRATLMTGSVSGSTGLTALVGSGTGRFRYNSDETATNYTTALGTGLYGIYREAPVITATVNSVVKTYDGIAYSGGNGVGAFSGLLNGESAQLGTITYTGTSQGAKNASTSTYALNAAASSGLGYAVSLTPGTLTINKANLTVTASSVTKTYDGTTSATGTGIVGTLD